jgi:hypothetical protein
LGAAGKSKRERSAYSAALIEGQANYPNDEIAAHRFATRVVNRALRVNAAGAQGEDRQKIIARAVHDAFPEDRPGGLGQLEVVKTCPSYVIACGPDGRIYMVDYSFGDGGIIFGEPRETIGTHQPIAV